MGPVFLAWFGQKMFLFGYPSGQNYFYLGPDHLESITLKIIDKKIDNLSCRLQSIIPENNRFFANYSGKQ